MSEDITFCFYKECKNRKCERHPCHIKLFYIPHSFSFFKECEHWKMEKTYYKTASGVFDLSKVGK